MKNLRLARLIRRQKIAEAARSTVASYFGPDVDAGYSYGLYNCSKCGFEQISNKGDMIHCANCGIETSLQANASLKTVKKAMDKITATFFCLVCGNKTITSSSDAVDELGMFCPQCGSVMEVEGGSQEDDEDIEIEDDEDIEIEDDEDIEIEDDEDIEIEDDEDIEIKEVTSEEDEDIEVEEVELEDEDIEVEEVELEDEDEDGDEDEDIKVTSEEVTEEDDTKIEEDDTEDIAIKDIEDEDTEVDDIEVTSEDDTIKVKDTEILDEDNTDDDAIEVTEDTENREEDVEEGMKKTASIEYITPIKETASYTADDIQMAFYQGDDPTWTVLVKGSPLALIKLSDQSRSEEIADMFVTDVYAQNVAQAMVQCGAREVLEQVKAKFFANKIDESELAARMADKVKAEMDNEFKTKVAGLQEEFKSCIAVVLAGMNRNFWRDVDNPLKASLFSNLKDLGISDPSQVIESAFAEGADPYFDIILSKAVDFMGKSPEAREEIANAISESNTILASTNMGIIPENNKLAKRLIQNNVIAHITGSNNINVNDKNVIKNTLRLGKQYRN